MSNTNYRIGQGYDIHRLVEGRRLILAGIEIPFELGLMGHSDADIVAHAICDALLGAAALGDIGRHFPDNDPRYAGTDSMIFLERAKELLVERGYQIANIDITVHAERPKLARYREQMREKLATVLGIELSQVSIKAKTNEGLDSVGRGEAMAATAVALIYTQESSSTGS